MDRKVVYCDRLMRHCEHVSSRCDEIAQLLDMMLETHDQLDGGEAEFDRLAGLIAGEDAAADHAIREYDRALDRKINLRRVLRSVMSEGVVVKFASISYTLRPTKGGAASAGILVNQLRLCRRGKLSLYRIQMWNLVRLSKNI